MLLDPPAMKAVEQFRYIRAIIDQVFCVDSLIGRVLDKGSGIIVEGLYLI